MEMEKKKKDYEAPDIEVTQIEVESSICNGSVDMKAQSAGADIEEQKVNTSFENDNTFTDWGDQSGN